VDPITPPLKLPIVPALVLDGPPIIAGLFDECAEQPLTKAASERTPTTIGHRVVRIRITTPSDRGHPEHAQGQKAPSWRTDTGLEASLPERAPET
jgi:hypothetical protein